MSLSPRLMMRQSQSLVMTPQLMQAIKLLQLSSLDLENYVTQEIESNPLLERAEADGPIGADAETSSAESAVPEAADWLQHDLPESRAALETGMGADLVNMFPDEPAAQPSGDGYVASSWAGLGAGADDMDASLEALPGAELSLPEHLEAQLGLATTDAALRMIGRGVIDCIDEAGYFRDDPALLAERLGATREEVVHALTMVQGFDPCGVGARDLRECLAIQLRERNRLDPAMERFLEHLDLVARRDLAALRRLCGVDTDDLHEMVAEIRRLNPKPGLLVGGGHVQTVIPDVLVRAAPDGSWLIELNAETLPRVLVNQTYYARVSQRPLAQGEKAFLAECLQNANWLTRSLEQRARTVLKVASEIVRQQDGFLRHGVHRLRPMNLRAVADAIGMHESTVSRVTSNKYIATPRGFYELKYFFTAAISATGHQESHSAEAVRHRIRQMIDREPPAGVLSDDAIVQSLRDNGVDIARRTVAKYRESMGIPSSVQRRREKVASA